jgi:GT2 family glycosyltransferase/glycosyltransferase involved in cell wall biosynthesis
MQERPPGRPVQLHVIHGLGGGSNKWLADFAGADTGRINLVLRSFSQGTPAGNGLALHADAGDGAPLRTWKFQAPIAATVPHHEEYRRALAEIVDAYGVGGIFVSSVIGHSLDVLDTGLPTLFVAHDYFPYCPAINLHFEAVCAKCDAARVSECEAGNPHFSPFADFPTADRLAARERFVERACSGDLVMVAPSASVGNNLKRLDARLRDVPFHVVPHGYADPIAHVDLGRLGASEKLRVLVLGQLSVAKGLLLLQGALPSLTRFADVYLLGAREVGTLFQYTEGVQVVSEFRREDLTVHVRAIRPHLALLPSIVPETFSYALSELWMMGVPPVATRLGAFEERVRDGVDGFLCEPDVHGVLSALRRLDQDRDALSRVREHIRDWRPGSAEAMVAQYHRLLPLSATAGSKAGATPSARDAVQDATVADMWKQVKSLTLELGLVNEARHRAEMQRAADARRLEEERRRAQRLARELGERDATLQEQDRHMQALVVQRDARAAQAEELLASTSWRVTAPLRMLGRGVHKVGILGRVAASTMRQPGTLRARTAQVAKAYREGGVHGAKKALVGMQQRETGVDPWSEYLEAFRREVRPRVIEAVRAMERRPLISILVPVHDPPEDMMRTMLDSVRAQLYGEWELCIVDDASTNARVREVLGEYAEVDSRIRPHFLEHNAGVSHASNVALGMATGEFTVLLDHDDLLEEHALFRVAQSVLEDDPDLLYSDELLVDADGRTPRRFAFRPGFSLEYLRSHPYIVHLAGFRTALLKELGGFDEGLRISQDYDLILRAVEKAKRIVHVPEVLYRWRIHGASAGTAKMAQVMATSRGVLDRHLQRCGIAGHAEDGESFNLFDVRYDLRPGMKVAIIVPTKNHGELVRQCIDSIRNTVKHVAYDIVVIDHDSDEPDTQDYLRAISGHAARVIKYSGPFNFSAINNFGVAQVAGPYTHYLFCNNDIEAMHEGWLERMLELGQQSDVAAVGAMLFYPDRETLQHAGVCVGMFGAAEHYAKRLRFPHEPVEAGFGELLRINHEVAAVTAACMLVSREAFDAVGGYDEQIAVGFGDVDLCLRMGQLGKRIVFCPHAQLVHHESFTRGTSHSDPHPEDSALYRMKWRGLLAAGDPFFHPSLSLWHTTWTLRRPLPARFEIQRRVARLGNGGRYDWIA